MPTRKEGEEVNEEDIQNHLVDVLRQVTPYVMTEARGRLFDVACYIPEVLDPEHEAFTSPEITHKKCPNFKHNSKFGYGTPVNGKDKHIHLFTIKDVCRNKDFFWHTWEPGDPTPGRFSSEYKEKGEAYWKKKRAEWRRIRKPVFKNTNGVIIHTKEEMEEAIMCDVAAGGRCEKFDRILDHGFLLDRNKPLGNGLILFEIKSNHDDMTRLRDQLQNYALFADRVYLIVGSRKKVPSWVPAWIGVFRYKHGKFFKERESNVIPRINGKNFADYVFRETERYNPYKGVPEMAFMYLKRWFVNSIFYWKFKRNIVPMPELDEMVIRVGKRGRYHGATIKDKDDGQTTLL